MTTECWANVYEMAGRQRVGPAHEMPAIAETMASMGATLHRSGKQSARPVFRIHVRLKPKGAPKRYRDEDERRIWEREHDWLTHCSSKAFAKTDPKSGAKELNAATAQLAATSSLKVVSVADVHSHISKIGTPA